MDTLGHLSLYHQHECTIPGDIDIGCFEDNFADRPLKRLTPISRQLHLRCVMYLFLLTLLASR